MSTSTPELTANAGIYVLQWNPENIRITLDRLDDHKHTTSGEITVKYKPPESPEFQHLHQARLNLTSTRERSSLAKVLQERVSEMDWGAVLEQACVRTLEKHREGAPVRMVGNQPQTERNRYRLYPLLLEQQPNMIYAPGGVGKTTLGCLCALLVETGEKRVGLDGMPGRALWLDYETSEEEINGILKRMKNGLGIDPDVEIAYRYCSQPVADDIANIQRMVLETQAQLVIVDSVGAGCGGEPESAEVMLKYFLALRSLRVTTLSLDHVAKENRGPFGSIYKWNACRCIWEAVKGSVGSNSNRIAIGLHHRKINSGPLLKPLGFQFSFESDCIIPEKANAKDIPELLAGMALADQIEAALLRQTMTVAELSEETGKPASTIAPTLSRHKNTFVSVGGGKWAVRTTEVCNDVA